MAQGIGYNTEASEMGTDVPVRELPGYTRVDEFTAAQAALDEWATAGSATFETNVEEVTLAEARRMILSAEGLATEHRTRANRADALVERLRERLHVLANASSLPEVKDLSPERIY